jgi:hypothetical protein
MSPSLVFASHKVGHLRPQDVQPGPGSRVGHAPQQLLSRPSETTRFIPDRHGPVDRNRVRKQGPCLVRSQVDANPST